MVEMRSFWCKDLPTIEDISYAYSLVKEQDIAVSIGWFVKYNGKYLRVITRETLEKYPTPETFFEKSIPHIYGM